MYEHECAGIKTLPKINSVSLREFIGLSFHVSEPDARESGLVDVASKGRFAEWTGI